MAEEDSSSGVQDDKMIVLYCENAHKKTMSQEYYLDWKSRHGPGTVMLCRKCNAVLVPEDEIPAPHLKSIKEQTKGD